MYERIFAFLGISLQWPMFDLIVLCILWKFSPNSFCILRETKKILDEYKFKISKSEQENSTLQATVARLESQVSPLNCLN